MEIVQEGTEFPEAESSVSVSWETTGETPSVRASPQINQFRSLHPGAGVQTYKPG